MDSAQKRHYRFPFYRKWKSNRCCKIRKSLETAAFLSLFFALNIFYGIQQSIVWPVWQCQKNWCNCQRKKALNWKQKQKRDLNTKNTFFLIYKYIYFCFFLIIPSIELSAQCLGLFRWQQDGGILQRQLPRLPVCLPLAQLFKSANLAITQILHIMWSNSFWSTWPHPHTEMPYIVCIKP